VRVATVALRQPRKRPPGTARHAPVAVTAVLVEDVAPPAAAAPRQWLLLTRRGGAAVAAAGTVVWASTPRRVLERFPLVL